MQTKKLADLKATNPYLRMGTDVSDLEKSIQTVGLIAPLVISEDNVILAGARRYQALLNLGYTEAPVTIISRGPLERELVSIDENLVRKDLSKMEIESHLRRAKEIYEQINPVVASEKNEDGVEVEVLPAEAFLNMVSDKTGLSAKQIHEAIKRDEMASAIVKEARKNGKLSLSQTNEIVKLSKDNQLHAIEHLKELPVREIKKFVKIANEQGVQSAIKQTPNDPFAREYVELNAGIRKLLKKVKQLDLEGIEVDDFPEETQKLLSELHLVTQNSSMPSTNPIHQNY